MYLQNIGVLNEHLITDPENSQLGNDCLPSQPTGIRIRAIYPSSFYQGSTLIILNGKVLIIAAIWKRTHRHSWVCFQTTGYSAGMK